LIFLNIYFLRNLKKFHCQILRIVLYDVIGGERV